MMRPLGSIATAPVSFVSVNHCVIFPLLSTLLIRSAPCSGNNSVPSSIPIKPSADISPVQIRSTFMPAATTPGIAVVTICFSGPVCAGAAGACPARCCPKITADIMKRQPTTINLDLVFIDSPIALMSDHWRCSRNGLTRLQQTPKEQHGHDSDEGERCRRAEELLVGPLSPQQFTRE